jgi:hypothetical protein
MKIRVHQNKKRRSFDSAFGKISNKSNSSRFQIRIRVTQQQISMYYKSIELSLKFLVTNVMSLAPMSKWPMLCSRSQTSEDMNPPLKIIKHHQSLHKFTIGVKSNLI